LDGVFYSTEDAVLARCSLARPLSIAAESANPEDLN